MIFHCYYALSAHLTLNSRHRNKSIVKVVGSFRVHTINLYPTATVNIFPVTDIHSHMGYFAGFSANKNQVTFLRLTTPLFPVHLFTGKSLLRSVSLQDNAV